MSHVRPINRRAQDKSKKSAVRWYRNESYPGPNQTHTKNNWGWCWTFIAARCKLPCFMCRRTTSSGGWESTNPPPVHVGWMQLLRQKALATTWSLIKSKQTSSNECCKWIAAVKQKLPLVFFAFALWHLKSFCNHRKLYLPLSLIYFLYK